MHMRAARHAHRESIDPDQSETLPLRQHASVHEREVLMPTESVIFLVLAVAAFSLFASVLWWADAQTRHS
jgi:hypothetical protein